MNYYLIDKANMTIVSGPHAMKSSYIKKLTNCGNPELLDLSVFDLVPIVYSPLAEGQKHGDPVVYLDRVEFTAVSKDSNELDVDLAMRIDQIDSAARALIDGSAHWTSGPMIWDKSKSKQKSNAIKIWVELIWGLYYQRVEFLKSGGAWSDELLDFSVLGPCPYNVKDAMLE